MKLEDHLRKANEIKESINRLLPEGGKHVVSVVELAYGLALHLIAHGMEARFGEHKDVHHGVPAQLRSHGQDEIAILFERLDTLRHGRWYGGKGNGEVVKEVMRIIGKIEEWCKK